MAELIGPEARRLLLCFVYGMQMITNGADLQDMELLQSACELATKEEDCLHAG